MLGNDKMFDQDKCETLVVRKKELIKNREQKVRGKYYEKYNFRYN